jgi:hypothetical protein
MAEFRLCGDNYEKRPYKGTQIGEFGRITLLNPILTLREFEALKSELVASLGLTCIVEDH